VHACLGELCVPTTKSAYRCVSMDVSDWQGWSASAPRKNLVTTFAPNRSVTRIGDQRGRSCTARLPPRRRSCRRSGGREELPRSSAAFWDCWAEAVDPALPLRHSGKNATPRSSPTLCNDLINLVIFYRSPAQHHSSRIWNRASKDRDRVHRLPVPVGRRQRRNHHKKFQRFNAIQCFSFQKFGINVVDDRHAGPSGLKSVWKTESVGLRLRAEHGEKFSTVTSPAAGRRRRARIHGATFTSKPTTGRT